VLDTHVRALVSTFMTSRWRFGSLHTAVLVACLALGATSIAQAESDHFRAGQSLGLSATVERDAGATASELVSRARGKIVVRNRSPFDADVYLGFDEASLAFVDTVPSGFKLIIRGLQRRTDYVLYAEDETGSWGPRFFFLRKKYIWTLLGAA
jgi:hypothetical protein